MIDEPEESEGRIVEKVESSLAAIFDFAKRYIVTLSLFGRNLWKNNFSLEIFARKTTLKPKSFFIISSIIATLLICKVPLSGYATHNSMASVLLDAIRSIEHISKATLLLFLIPQFLLVVLISRFFKLAARSLTDGVCGNQQLDKLIIYLAGFQFFLQVFWSFGLSALLLIASDEFLEKRILVSFLIVLAMFFVPVCLPASFLYRAAKPRAGRFQLLRKCLVAALVLVVHTMLFLTMFISWFAPRMIDPDNSIFFSGTRFELSVDMLAPADTNSITISCAIKNVGKETMVISKQNIAIDVNPVVEAHTNVNTDLAAAAAAALSASSAIAGGMGHGGEEYISNPSDLKIQDDANPFIMIDPGKTAWMSFRVPRSVLPHQNPLAAVVVSVSGMGPKGLPFVLHFYSVRQFGNAEMSDRYEMRAEPERFSINGVAPF